MTDIKVTQEDRKRASAYANDLETAEKVLAGLLDDHPIVQDYARHRIEAQRPLLEALVMARRGLTADDVEPLEAMSILIMVDAAIKQAKGE